MATALILLAAGKGTRMQSDMPKVLHEIGNAPLLHHAMMSATAIAPEKMIVVAGHGAEAVEAAARAYDPDVEVVLQTEQLGTAHAVEQARALLDGFDGDILILYGDTPFIKPETLDAMLAARAHHAVVVLGFEAKDPARYGRLVTDGDTLQEIVEFKDATDAQRAITLCNSGVIAADCATLFDLLSEVGNENATGEYYLTDIPGLARKRGLGAGVVRCDEAETLGINSRAELAAAEGIFQRRMRETALENGVNLQAPETVQFSADTVLGCDCVIEPNVVFARGVTIETGARIRAFSHLEGCHVARGAVVGPYARLRPGTELSEDVRIGNFVEVKNARLDEGAKVNHLSYIGDATVGAASNIGAGTITCNYDGVLKHHTTIGARVFVGSNTMLVAPVAIGDDAMTASGSVITRDVPATDLAVARAQQENKAGLAVKLFDKLRAIKAKRQKDSS